MRTIKTPTARAILTLIILLRLSSSCWSLSASIRVVLHPKTPTANIHPDVRRRHERLCQSVRWRRSSRSCSQLEAVESPYSENDHTVRVRLEDDGNSECTPSERRNTNEMSTGNANMETQSSLAFTTSTTSTTSKTRRSLLVGVSSGFTTAVAAVATATATVQWTNEVAHATGTTVAVAALETRFDSEEVRRIAVFEKVSPSVVFVDTFTERRDSLTTNIMEVPLGSGSGIVWDRDGHIVTNFHVIRNAQSAQVAVLLSGEDAVAASKVIASSDSKSSGSSDLTILRSSTPTSSNGLKSKTAPNMVRRTFTARIVGVDPGKDIAVLKIDADPVFLFPIAVGTSQGIKVGQQAMAIGNPFGLDHTLTSGIISGTGREVRSPIGRPITDVLQTDAAINPGNSGGPLLDSSGKLIGMNTAIYSPSGASAGIGFAIPVDAVKVIVDTLIRDGQVIRPILGISFLGSKQARTLGISSGVLVLDVPPDSPAAKAGLKGTRRTASGLIELGDIIVKVGGQSIDVEADLFSALEDLKPGDKVEVTVNRIVAVNDELQMKEIVLNIALQSSSQLEKNMLQLLYQVPAQ